MTSKNLIGLIQSAGAGVVAINLMAIPQRIILGVNPFEISGAIFPSLVGCVGGAILGYLIINLRERAGELERRVEERTAELQERNEKLLVEIAQRKVAEDSLRESEIRNRSLVDHAPVGILLADNEGRIAEVNPRLLDILGFPREEATKSINMLTFSPLVESGISDAYKRCMAEEQNAEVEVTYVSKWGKSSDLRIVLTPRLDSGGNISGCQALVEDITDSKKAQETIRQQAVYLTSILESVTEPVLAIDATDYTVHMANSAAAAVGYIDQTTCYSTCHGKTEPCDDPEHPCPIEEVKRTGQPKTVLHTHYVPDGEPRLIEVHAYPVTDGKGNVTQIVQYLHDITDRKKAEEALKESDWIHALRSRISTIFLTVPDDQMYGEVLQVVLEATESDYGMFGYVNEEGAFVCPSMTRDIWEKCKISDKDLVFPRESWGGLWGRCLKEQKAFCSNHRGNTPHGHVPIERSLGVPIVHGTDLAGLIVVANKDTDYEDKDSKLLETIARHVAPILRARLRIEKEEARRKKAEKALREAHEKLELRVDERTAELSKAKDDADRLNRALLEERRMFVRGPAVVFKWRNEEGWPVEYVSRNVEAVFGYTAAEFVTGKVSYADIIHEEDVGRVANEVKGYSECGSTDFEHEDYRVIRKDGTSIWLSDYTTILRNHKEEITHYHGYVIDVTNRKRVEEALGVMNLRLIEAQRIAEIGSWDWNVGTGELTWSEEVYRIFGLSRSTFGATYDAFLGAVHPDDRDFVKKSVEDALNRGKAYDIEHRVVTPSGEERIVHERAVVISDQAGQPARMLGTAQDITDRKRAEASVTLLASAVEQAGEQVVVTDAHLKIQYVNPAFERVTGYTREEVMGLNPRLLKSGQHDEAFYKDMWDTLAKGEPWTGHIINKKKDGSFFEEDASISPIKDELGNIVNYVAVKRDVTEEVKIERQFRQSQKMEAIGTLAGGIAHDFNNILTAITGYTDLAIHDLPEDSSVRADMEEVAKAGKRATELVKQILAFSRQTEEERHPVNVGLIAKEALKLLRASIPSSIEISRNIDTKARTVLADPTQIHQVIMNLCTNAYHSMEGRHGVLAVGLLEETIDADSASVIRADMKPGTYVHLTVTDTGRGMSKEVIDRIFEPFFTTKAVGEGTGMGLSVIHGIVERLGGVIIVQSEEGKGSAFHVYLPLTEKALERESVETEQIEGGREQIMFVDDEEPIANLGDRILESLGYVVTVFTDPSEAWDAFRERPSDFDLVVTDLTMPRMTGLELSVAVLNVRPEIPIIMSTGYGESLDLDEISDKGIRAMLKKPLTRGSLGKAVRKALEEKAEA